jgi:hypothetical protein
LKVTIDSTEPLGDALRVIGALYKVSLNVVDDAGAVIPQAADANASSSRRTSSARSRRRGQNTRAGRENRNVGSVSVAEIRRWALENGHRVSIRGTLPASIKAAYADAHSR